MKFGQVSREGDRTIMYGYTVNIDDGSGLGEWGYWARIVVKCFRGCENCSALSFMVFVLECSSHS